MSFQVSKGGVAVIDGQMILYLGLLTGCSVSPVSLGFSYAPVLSFGVWLDMLYLIKGFGTL